MPPADPDLHLAHPDLPSLGGWLPAGVALALQRSDEAALEARAAAAGVAPYADALHPRRRADFLAGRLAARAALQRLGATATTVGRAGEAPVWPAGHCGSISHGAGWAVAIAANAPPWRALGVDVQARIGPDRRRALRHALSEDEALACERDPDPWAWTRAWSAKEAAYKCAAALGADPALASLQPEWHGAQRGSLRLPLARRALRIELASRVEADLMWVVASLAEADAGGQSAGAGRE